MTRCGRSVATVEPRPRLPLKTRSRICAVSISKVCVHDGRACFRDRRPITCRGICCSRSSPIGFRPIASAISITRPGRCWIGPTRRKPAAAMSARLVSFDQKRTELTPGTVLVREWDRQSQRVMVMADGFAWNGQTYDSLSKVAFAITGTRWNGPRFFGLRDKEDRSGRRRPGHEDLLQSNRFAAPSTPGSPPSTAWTRSSTRWMPNTMPHRPISRARPMPAGP